LSSRLVFGPVPSRRLGMSLGVNNVYDKYCSYACVYCSVGHTTRMIIDRREFYPPEKILEDVLWGVSVHKVDVVTFVPNGEPTLDSNLGVEARMIKEHVEKPLAIITNSSLIYRDDVREDLQLFDIVSLKVDSVIEEVWKRINRPHPRLRLDDILEGVRVFSKQYNGRLITETMLVEGLNDNERVAKANAEYLKTVKIHKAYITTPVRPPAEPWVKPPTEEKLLIVYNTYARILGADKVELLAEPEKPFFGFTNDLVDEVARTIYVHPLPISYIYKLASERGLDGEKVVEELVGKGYAKVVEYLGKEFLVPKTRR
jgi:wyosine [tRNA(Phe)-imidazoG37] synthetase (radical SAM superfamily)